MSQLGKTVRISFTRDDCWQNKLTIECLFGILKYLPVDTAVKAIGSNWKNDLMWIEVYHDKFPETPVGQGCWEITASFTEGDKILNWPSEFDGLLKRDTSNDFDTWANESPAAGTIDMSELLKQAAGKWFNSQVPSSNGTATGCQHEWYMTSRFSALKHCKLCSKVFPADDT